MFIRLLFASALLAASGIACSEDAAIPAITNSIACKQTSESVVVIFGYNRHPTYFGVLTPQDEFVYLRYLPRKIDVLGKRYKHEPLVIPLRNLEGYVVTGNDLVRKRVFATPGKYVLRFEDANRIAHDDIFRLSCEIVISDQTSSTGSTGVGSACTATDGIGSFVSTKMPSKSLVGCFATNGCGVERCCNANRIGGPCYCSMCCVAKPPPIFQNGVK